MWKEGVELEEEKVRERMEGYENMKSKIRRNAKQTCNLS